MSKLDAEKENCMLGAGFPFFLNNGKLGNSYYFYQIYSPKLSEDLVPYISLTKVVEKTSSEPWGNGNDILAMCLGSKKNLIDAGKDLVESLLSTRDVFVESDNNNFPLIEINDANGNNDVQKLLITGLRDALRWKIYRFQPGRQIDILWTPEEFVVFNICGDDNTFYLEPDKAYKIDDVELRNPLDVDLSKLEDYPKDKFERKPWKFSEVNRIIKSLEWRSFKRETLV